MATEEPKSNETASEGAPQTPGSGPTGAQKSGEELVEELGRLSRKFVEAVEVAWNSDQRKEIEQDLRAGLKKLADSLETGLHDLGEQEKTKQFVGKAEDVAESVSEKIRSSEKTHELAAALTVGLAAVSDRLEKLINEMQTREAPKPPAGTPVDNQPASAESSQDIPIDRP